jgi:hypothetical protein
VAALRRRFFAPFPGRRTASAFLDAPRESFEPRCDLEVVDSIRQLRRGFSALRRMAAPADPVEQSQELIVV